MSNDATSPQASLQVLLYCSLQGLYSRIFKTQYHIASLTTKNWGFRKEGVFWCWKVQHVWKSNYTGIEKTGRIFQKEFVELAIWNDKWIKMAKKKRFKNQQNRNPIYIFQKEFEELTIWSDKLINMANKTIKKTSKTEIPYTSLNSVFHLSCNFLSESTFFVAAVLVWELDYWINSRSLRQRMDYNPMWCLFIWWLQYTVSNFRLTSFSEWHTLMHESHPWCAIWRGVQQFYMLLAQFC